MCEICDRMCCEDCAVGEIMFCKECDSWFCTDCRPVGFCEMCESSKCLECSTFLDNADGLVCGDFEFPVDMSGLDLED